MNDAERRFRARADRFRRDLNNIVFRAIDKTVNEALRDAAKKERAAEREAAKKEAALQRAAAKQEAARKREALKAARAAEAAQKKELARAERERKRLGRTSGAPGPEQLELRLGIGEVLGAKPKAHAPTRVREDSILGAELRASIDLSREVAVGVESMFSGTTRAAAPPSKQPSERPLFVHKRARDGRIHELRRGAAPPPGSQEPPGTGGSIGG